MPVATTKTAVIVGIDEAGRGALAGPVVAGACILPDAYTKLPHFLRDSKQLDPRLRSHAYTWVCDHCIHGCGIVDAEDIDEHGILYATEKAMQIALSEVAQHTKPTYVLVDGRDAFWFDYPHSSIVRGDVSEPCISAASIVAKVTRDRLMVEYEKEFPHFSFSYHKGYGTPEHIDLIKSRGPSRIHRKTFLTKI